MKKQLLSFGHGYSARALTPLLLANGFSIVGSIRSNEKADEVIATGVTPVIWSKSELIASLHASTHLLISAAPSAEGDPVLGLLRDEIADYAPHLEWVGYLSTTGVYGDAQGAWVDEDSKLSPSTKRGEMRVAAEAEWRAIEGLPLHIFRLAGIYGPGRGPFSKVRARTARRIIKQGQVFSRIHVEDIAQVLAASIAAPNAGSVYNLCDDDPAPPQDVIAHAAELLGLPLPEAVDFETAEMTPMARSFYAENKRVRNDKIKAELGVKLGYPNYRTGLAKLLELERAADAG
ncbi:SDR family oxidoreductase [Planktotalea sp.]|uniref:SDR family oxidoreductase n=1 Tax=Planktotalea sp. TaxID=2029877 RepID=UPI003D6A2E64